MKARVCIIFLSLCRTSEGQESKECGVVSAESTCELAESSQNSLPGGSSLVCLNTDPNCELTTSYSQNSLPGGSSLVCSNTDPNCELTTSYSQKIIARWQFTGLFKH